MPETYQEQYDEAVANGSLLNPMPDSYEPLRGVVARAGVGDYSYAIFWLGADKSGVEGKFNSEFETYIPKADAQRFIDYVKPKWDAVVKQRAENAQ